MSTATQNRKVLSGPGIIFFLSALVFLFYLSTAVLKIDVYRYATVGAFFELLSLPMLLLLVIIPIISLIQLFRKNRTGKVYSILSLALTLITILLLTAVD